MESILMVVVRTCLYCRFIYAILFAGGFLLLTACNPGSSKTRPDYQQAHATLDKKLTEHPRRAFRFKNAGIEASNQFQGGRLSDFTYINDSTFTATIRPENEPVNNSAWYAFRLWSSRERTITVHLCYKGGKHRYVPHIHRQGQSWSRIGDEFFSSDTSLGTASVHVQVGPDSLWIAGQPLFTSKHFKQAIDSLEKLPFITAAPLGRSKYGRMIQKLVIGSSPSPGRYIAVISRQHPPEVTGTVALFAFLDALCADNAMAERFRREFSTVVIPLMNPDGVDNGHWRHNAGGIDLNRDWLYFNQPETRLAKDEFLSIKNNGGKLYFFLDFHSTWHDIFYTLNPDLPTDPPEFTKKWLTALQDSLPSYPVRNRPAGTKAPVSKSWFYLTFQIPSVTYELGDQADRATTQQVARMAARIMMEQLLATIDSHR